MFIVGAYSTVNFFGFILAMRDVPLCSYFVEFPSTVFTLYSIIILICHLSLLHLLSLHYSSCSWLNSIIGHHLASISPSIWLVFPIIHSISLIGWWNIGHSSRSHSLSELHTLCLPFRQSLSLSLYLIWFNLLLFLCSNK